MIVEPDLTNHPKFVQLKSLIGEVAMELLVRLWTHCQQNKRGHFWRGANADYVEVVCAGHSRRGKLFAALRDCGWIQERDDGLEIHDWDKHNASLIARWKRDAKPAQMSAQTSAPPTTQKAGQQSAQTPDRTGQDRTGQESIRTSNGTRASLAQAPSLKEAVDYGKTLAGGVGDLNGCPAVDDTWVEDWWQWREGSVDASWDRLRDWKKDLRYRWRKQWQCWQRKTAMANGEPARQGVPLWLQLKEMDRLIEEHAGNPDGVYGSVEDKQTKYQEFRALVKKRHALGKEAAGCG